MKIIQLITLIHVSILLFACNARIDSKNENTYKESLKEIKKHLTENEKDSLEKCMLEIIAESEHGKLEIDEMINHFDGKSAEEILFLGGEIIKRKKYIADSIRFEFLSDSIKKYDEQGLWEIKYFVDEFQEETESGYIVNIAQGVFSNSATTNSELLAKLIITDEKSVQLFLYEYGSQNVKSYSRNSTLYTIKVLKQNRKVQLLGRMYDDRILFNSTDQNLLLRHFEGGGKIKILVMENSDYGSSSEYLVEFDVTNYKRAFQKLID